MKDDELKELRQCVKIIYELIFYWQNIDFADLNYALETLIHHFGGDDIKELWRNTEDVESLIAIVKQKDAIKSQQKEIAYLKMKIREVLDE